MSLVPSKVDSKGREPIKDSKQYDPDAVIYEYRNPQGEVFPIDWSWYMAVREMFDMANQLSWSTNTMIWMGNKSLTTAIYGHGRVKQKTKGDRAFQAYPQDDPQQGLYNVHNGGGIYGKHPQYGFFFPKRYADEKQFQKHLEEVAQREWASVSDAIKTGGVYVYHGV